MCLELWNISEDKNHDYGFMHMACMEWKKPEEAAINANSVHL